MFLSNGIRRRVYCLTTLEVNGNEGYIDGSRNADTRSDLNFAFDARLVNRLLRRSCHIKGREG